MGGVSSVLDSGQQPSVQVPDGYQTPPFPSLYNPVAGSTLGNRGHFLYQAYTIWQFQLYWNLILFGGIFFICSIAFFTTSLLSLTVLRRLPPEPTNDREKLRRPRKPFPIWPVFLIPFLWAAAGALVALVCSGVVGFVLAAVYNAAGFSFSTWVPFLWGFIQVLVLIISLGSYQLYMHHNAHSLSYERVSRYHTIAARILIDLVTVEEVLPEKWRLDDGSCVVHREDSYTEIIPSRHFKYHVKPLSGTDMGKFIYHQWGRLLAITSATYMLWASMWAFFYRKFFWDVIGGTLGPAGIIPDTNSRPFVAIIVDLPILQMLTLSLSLLALMIELPAPFMKGTALHRSLVLRVMLYFITGFFGIFVYQTVDCAVYFVITSTVYAKALMNDESIDGPMKHLDVV